MRIWASHALTGDADCQACAILKNTSNEKQVLKDGACFSRPLLTFRALHQLSAFLKNGRHLGWWLQRAWHACDREIVALLHLYFVVNEHIPHRACFAARPMVHRLRLYSRLAVETYLFNKSLYAFSVAVPSCTQSSINHKSPQSQPRPNWLGTS